MLDAAIAKLGNVLLDPDLTIATPRGGRISLSLDASAGEDKLVIDCDSETSLWEAFDLASRLGLVSLDYSGLQQLRNPLLQSLEVVVDGRALIEWAPRAYPRIRSLRGLLRVLRRRKR